MVLKKIMLQVSSMLNTILKVISVGPNRRFRFLIKDKSAHESKISDLIFIVRNYKNEKKIMLIVFIFLRVHLEERILILSHKSLLQTKIV